MTMLKDQNQRAEGRRHGEKVEHDGFDCGENRAEADEEREERRAHYECYHGQKRPKTIV